MAKILLVDDSDFMRDMLQDILIEDGYEVYHLADGEKIIEEYERVLPDVLLMDIVMPGLDGLSATDVLIQKHPEAKIIMCSAQGQKIVKEEAEKKGALGFIEKPFSVEDILTTVKNIL